METQVTSALRERTRAVAFYDDRYEHDYLVDWPEEKKRQIHEVIDSLELPTEGTALDFGCGNGVFAEVMRRALPAWHIFGTDISTKAIANARRRYPACTFFEADDPEFRERRFDFLFSHHVLEHVSDLQEALDQMTARLKPRARMLHFLPCGNEGSYEWMICSLREGGIAPELENRFFFEDEGHVRRLTTDQLTARCAERGFELEKEYYLNHYRGAIDWITSSGISFVGEFADSTRAIDAKARRRLEVERFRLLLITRLRLIAPDIREQLARKSKSFGCWIRVVLESPLYPISRLLDRHLKRGARREWETNRASRNGSEMCLVLVRR